MKWAKGKVLINSIIVCLVIFILNDLQAQRGRSSRGGLPIVFDMRTFVTKTLNPSLYKRSPNFKAFIKSLKKVDSITHDFLKNNKESLPSLKAREQHELTEALSLTYDPIIEPRVARFARSIHDREDLTQDIRLSFLLALDSFLKKSPQGAKYSPDRGSPLQYLQGVIRNTEKNYYKGLSHKIPSLSEKLSREQLREPYIEVIDRLLGDWLHNEEAIYSLPFRQEQVAELALLLPRIQKLTDDLSNNVLYQRIYLDMTPEEILNANLRGISSSDYSSLQQIYSKTNFLHRKLLSQLESTEKKQEN